MERAQTSVRRATAADLPFLCRNGELLARQHHEYDPIRFVIFEPAEEAFSRYFSAQLESDEAVFLIAEAEGEPVGYAFLRMEPESFVDLAGPCVWLHDLYVIEAARGSGAGAQLIEAAKQTARAMGSPALMLSVAPQNARARRRFEAHGFRPTMLEMRVELDAE